MCCAVCIALYMVLLHPLILQSCEIVVVEVVIIVIILF